MYDDASLREIILRSADILGIDITDDGAVEIGSRARGTPRVANRLLRRVRDYAEVRMNGSIDLPPRAKGWTCLVWRAGAGRSGRKMLHDHDRQIRRPRVGLDTIAARNGRGPRPRSRTFTSRICSGSGLSRGRRAGAS